MTAWNEFILAATFLDDAARFTPPVALQQFVAFFFRATAAPRRGAYCRRREGL
jgi:ABC-type maltose transport system permease subunit